MSFDTPFRQAQWLLRLSGLHELRVRTGFIRSRSLPSGSARRRRTAADQPAAFAFRAAPRFATVAFAGADVSLTVSSGFR